MSVYCPTKNILWIHVPKTAGTSIRLAIWNDHANTMHNHNTFDWMLHHHPKALLNFQNVYSFSVVRNPYDRLVSAFFSIWDYGYCDLYGPNFDDFILNDFKDGFGGHSIASSRVPKSRMHHDTIHLNKPNTDSPDVSYPVHLIAQTSFIKSSTTKNPVKQLKRILKFETLEYEWYTMMKDWGMYYELPKSNIGKTRNRDWQEYYQTHKEEKIKIVSELYKEDFVNFGYGMEIK